MANAITTTSSATLELQAERTWKYLTSGDYTAVFQYLKEIPWVRIYTLTLQAIMAFITFFYVMGYVAVRALRLAYDAIRAAAPIVISWINQQQERAMALRQQLVNTSCDVISPQQVEIDEYEAFFCKPPAFSRQERSFGTALDQEPEPTTESIQ